MRATKKRIGLRAAMLAGFVALLAGCTPPGPQALLEGRDLLEAEKYPEAVERLTLATAILTNNAHAWNYLGLALHRTGEATRAVEAYRRALALDRDLFEAHFNLGCLWLDEGKPDAARSEFTACTLRRGDSFDAWLKLGVAHYRLGELTSAENSFQKARKLSPNHPEVLNGLGLVSAQRRRAREAVQYFNAALKQQPDYRAALLNLATVLQRDLGDVTGAVQRYREFVALDPQAADAVTVKAILQSLEPKPETKPAPVAVAAVPVTPPVTNPVVTNAIKPPVVAPAVPSPVKSNPPAPVVVKPAPAETVVASAEIVRLPPEPVIRTAPQTKVAAPPRALPLASAASESPPFTASTPATTLVAPVKAEPEKRGFLSRLNPFRGSRKSDPKAVEVASAAPPANASHPAIGEQPAESFPRYRYQRPAAPAPGNRAEAEAALARGREAESGVKPAQAIPAYQQATQMDPAYFEAQYHLALAQYTLRDYTAALAGWETALAIRPDSTEARYNFALTLKSAGYALDAAVELERILATSPDDVRAHLILGNLCAEPLRDKSRARVHYQRILELDLRHPQATAIRYWLVANPG